MMYKCQCFYNALSLLLKFDRSIALLTVWEESPFDVVQKVVIAEYQIDSTGISAWRTGHFSCICYVLYCISIKMWLFIVMVSYLIV